MSMVTTVLYSPLNLDGAPVVARMSLPCRTSRMTIRKVRRILSETEIAKYGRPKKLAIGVWGLFRPQACQTSIIIPIAEPITLAQSITAGLAKIRTRTHRAKVHEAGKGSNPEVPGVNHIATKELEEKRCETPGQVDAAPNKALTKRPSANR